MTEWKNNVKNYLIGINRRALKDVLLQRGQTKCLAIVDYAVAICFVCS